MGAKEQADNWATEIEVIVGMQFLIPFFANKLLQNRDVFLMSRDMIPEPSKNKPAKF